MNDRVARQTGRNAVYEGIAGPLMLESGKQVELGYQDGQCTMAMDGKTESCPPGMRFVRTQIGMRYLATPCGWEAYNGTHPITLSWGCHTVF